MQKVDIIQFFAFRHLPPALQAVSQPFSEFAMQLREDKHPPFAVLEQQLRENVPNNSELEVALQKLAESRGAADPEAALRKLLEAKDAAVRAVFAK